MVFFLALALLAVPGGVSKSGKQADAAPAIQNPLAVGSPLAAGGAHTCALTHWGGVLCWGGNTAGQLGDGSFNNRPAPGWVNGFAGSGADGMNVGYLHSCALTPPDWSPQLGAAIKCWGWNYFGQLGIGTHQFSQTSPVPVSGFASAGAAAITLGEAHTCALTVAGGVRCWGSNLHGQLGNTTTISSTVPVDVYHMTSGMAAVAAGSFHTCAITSPGALECWGANGSGQLGDTTTISSTVPVSVTGLTSGVVAVAPGGFHTCALTSTGGVKCWGQNTVGQLGDGMNCNQYAPVSVTGLESGVTAITSGTLHSCALTDAGGVKCWGWNFYGQLGDGTKIDRNTPVSVSGLESGVVAVDAGSAHTCAMLASGAVLCWGDNTYGQLGNDIQLESLVPVEVAGYPDNTMLLPVIYR